MADVIVGAGLLHVQSGTCALDIDDLDKARVWLAERGVDVDALLEDPKAVRIHSGRPGRAKLLYRLKTPMRTFKPTDSGIELRCATGSGKSVQDVLPPTVHRDTRKPYTWLYSEPMLGDWRNLPPLPATLRAAWRTLIDEAAPEPEERPRANGHDTGIALEKLYEWIKGQSPDADYDTWVKVGMKLHDATGGAEEGLALWDDWSSKATRKRTNGLPAYAKGGCRVHWLSFSSGKGKHIATLDKELPAEADEFEVEDVEAEAMETPAEAKQRETKKTARKDAIAALEKKLVYVVSAERYFDTDRHRVIGSDSALEHMYTSMMPLGKNGRMNPVRVLKSSTTKQSVEGLGFHPGEGAIFKVGDDSYANLYRNRLPVPIEPTPKDLERIDWLFSRIDDDNYRRWLRQYYAHIVQRPGIKLKSAPLLWSETQRNGKTTLLKAIPSLLVGQEYSADVSYEMLNHTHNDYLQGAWHVNLTEFRAGTRGERTMVNNKLKAYIADDMIPLHPKGSRGYTMPNHFFVTASSNEEDAAAIDNNDERWGVHEFKQPKFTERERQWIYYEFLLQPRAAAVLRHYFLHVDLTGFHAAGGAPMTESKQEMASASLPADAELLNLMYEERNEYFSRDVVITGDVASYLQRHCVAKPSAKRVGRMLTKPPFNGVPVQFRVGSRKYRAVIIRNHKRWNGATGQILWDHIQGDDDDIDMLS